MSARLLLYLALVVGLGLPAPVHARPLAPWERLPLPPAMPRPTTTSTVAVAGARIYYATFGNAASTAAPVILLHGGMGNSDHFAFQLPALAEAFHVIAIDTRGHGRSTLGTRKLTTHLMAGDVIAVMDRLKIDRAAFVGWSDGGSIALELAITRPARVAKLFVLGTNYDTRGSRRRTRGQPPATTFARYAAKCRADHAALTGKPKSFDAMLRAMRPVWRSPGTVTRAQLQKISVPTMVALGVHDEIIARAQIEEMAALIPAGQLQIFEDASHFALWQAPDAVNAVLARFLAAP